MAQSSQPIYGIVFNRQSDQLLPIVDTDMSTIFLIGVSEDAVAQTFPVDQSVVINSSDQTMLAALGTGDLLTAVQLINAQLAPRQVAARIVVHRIAKGGSDAQTIANILGSQAAGTGIFAALSVGPALGVVPRLLLIAGGYTGKNITRAVSGKVVTQAARFGGNTGSGLMTLAAPAFGNGVQAGVYRVRCKTAAANGGVFSVVDPTGNVLADATVGQAYAGQVAFTIADGPADFIVGDGFDVTVTVTAGAMNANPIAVSLPQIEAALAAHSIVDGPNTTAQDAMDYRATLSSDHTILVDFAVTPAAAQAGTFVAGAAVAAGIGVRVDYDNDGVPSQSWASQAIYGITALQRYDSFSLNSGTNTGQELLATQVGIAQRGNAGDPGAVSNAGFVLVAFSTCSIDPTWQFFNVTRLRDYIHLNLQGFWRLRIGVSNITLHAVQAVENDAIQFLTLLKGDPKQHIIDFRVGINALDNSPATIEAGKLRVYFKAEEASPLLLIVADSYRYPDALTTLVSDIAGETNQLIASA